MLVAAAGIGIACTDGDGKIDPSVGASATTVLPVGFDQATVSVTTAAGEDRSLRLWVADSPEERGRGLMGVIDLGDAAGMLFLFDDLAVRNFYMWQTPMPLTVAFFDESGTFVASADMEPCLEASSADCERYAPDAPYLTAIEVPAGQLDELGIGEGSRIIAPPP